MSKNKETNAFIKNVHLKGFKSIKDLEVRLNNGLNIIIGPNGSGKTNFVDFVDALLKFDNKPKSQQQYSASIIGKNSESEFEIKEIYEIKENNLQLDIEGNSEILLLIDNKISELPLLDNLFTLSALSIYGGIKIPFTTPKEFDGYMLSEFGQLQLTKDKVIINVLRSLFAHTLRINLYLIRGKNYTEENTEWILRIEPTLLENLRRFSPIKDLRLSPGFSRIVTEKEITFKSLMLDFYVNNTWLTWSELSDGTKRIFHIISEINYTDSLILLEEPENGVHPDQLFLLLDFIKEQSKHKQIIITTHSPEVLNILEKDELDRIIVTRYEEETGTQMHHLSEKTKKKGQAYMNKIGHLSAFWLHSSLEKYIPAEHE
jgi:ABC-type multidrug transport system ATPase subunit